jgi:hypothetical protein
VTYNQAQEQAFELTIRQARGSQRLIIREYNKAHDEIKKELNITEAQYFNRLQKIGRLTELSKDIDNILNTYYGEIISITRNNSINSFVNQYYFQQYSMAWFTPEVFPFHFVNQTATQVSVYWTDKVWDQLVPKSKRKYGAYKPKWGTQQKTLKSLLLNNRQKQLKWIKSSIAQGLIQGRSLTKTAELLEDAFGKSKRNALRTVRTETIRNLNGGDYLNTQNAKDEGVELFRTWLATFSATTRQQSATMDGQKEDENGYFHYPDGSISRFPGGSGNPAYDINERCVVRNILDEQAPRLRRGRNPVTGESEIMTYRTFPQWAEENNLVYNNGRWIKK